MPPPVVAVEPVPVGGWPRQRQAYGDAVAVPFQQVEVFPDLGVLGQDAYGPPALAENSVETRTTNAPGFSLRGPCVALGTDLHEAALFGRHDGGSSSSWDSAKW